MGNSLVALNNLSDTALVAYVDIISIDVVTSSLAIVAETNATSYQSAVSVKFRFQIQVLPTSNLFIYLD